MAKESPADTPSEKKESIKEYASKVFKESSSPVSAIVSTGSIPRKIFRALIFILFTTGFLYQCIKFLAYVLTYPTIVNLEINKPETYITPAFTFCNNNKIKRTKFCAKHPEDCIIPTPEFCDENPFYCKDTDDNETDLVPKEELYLGVHDLEDENVLELGHDLKDLLKVLTTNQQSYYDSLEGPLLRSREQDSDKGNSGCFSINGRVDSPLDPVMSEKKGWWKSPDFVFTFDPEETERFNPDSPSGVLLAVHSQFDAANPFERGMFLKPGYMYKLIINMEEENLLPPPYKTDCLNYTERWLKYNKSGPRSKEMCTQRCVVMAAIACFNCTMTEQEYPSDVRYCAPEEVKPSCIHRDFDEIYTALLECVELCKDECEKMKYIVETRERKILPKWVNGTLTKNSRLIKVYIEIEDAEVISLEYKPQYQTVEAFSYVGGFIGIWLGISLVQVADFFEATFRIIRYFFTKGTRTCTASCCKV